MHLLELKIWILSLLLQSQRNLVFILKVIVPVHVDNSGNWLLKGRLPVDLFKMLLFLEVLCLKELSHLSLYRSCICSLWSVWEKKVKKGLFLKSLGKTGGVNCCFHSLNLWVGCGTEWRGGRVRSSSRVWAKQNQLYLPNLGLSRSSALCWVILHAVFLLN